MWWRPARERRRTAPKGRRTEPRPQQTETGTELVTETLVEGCPSTGCAGLLIDLAVIETSWAGGCTLRWRCARRAVRGAALPPGTRRLSFLKNRTIAAVVGSLARTPRCALGAEGAAGVDPADEAPYRLGPRCAGRLADAGARVSSLDPGSRLVPSSSSAVWTPPSA